MELFNSENTIALKWVIGVVAVVSILGFVVFDVAYTAVVINYSIQCQLMVYYLQSISTRIINREWDIEQSIKVRTMFQINAQSVCLLGSS